MRDFGTVADRAKFIAIDLIGKTAFNMTFIFLPILLMVKLNTQ